MALKVQLFGKLADICGAHELEMYDLRDTDALLQELSIRFPRIKEIPVLMAVNRAQVNGNIVLNDSSQIALMPPFSGG